MTIEGIEELGTILAVFAHPDDETYLAAGVFAAARDAGSRVVCVTATRGERGTPDPVAWPPERLARLRERELAAALDVLGVEEHHWLGYGDGECAEAPHATAVARVTAQIEVVQPDTILTFGPDGITGHSDHRAVSRWVGSAHDAAGAGARLLHATTRLGNVARFADVNTRFDVYLPGFPHETPSEELAIDLELRGTHLDRKLLALHAQGSQTSPLVAAIGEDRYREWVAHESFVDAPALATVGSLPLARAA